MAQEKGVRLFLKEQTHYHITMTLNNNNNNNKKPTKRSSKGKESACNTGDPGRCPGGGNDNPLQCSCLENPMDRGVRQVTVHVVTKSRTRLSN